MRQSGILLPVTSLPSPYGIGTMGKTAYNWIDFLERSYDKNGMASIDDYRLTMEEPKNG